MIKLNQVVFINSASFDFAKVQIEGNTLFCGANGVGKTTILRALLFFYSANSKRLGINQSKKKSFHEYYFESLNSYLIYRYKNIHGINYVLLYKTSHFSPIKFRFFSSYKEIDLQKLFIEDSIALNIEKVIAKIREEKINISNVIASAKEYRDILYGQTREYKEFALLKANQSFNQIHKTISNIFINSKLDSDVIKKSLVSDIDDFIPIDLQNISSNLSRFLDDIEVIDEYEKNEENIKSAIKNYKQYFEKEQFLKDESKKLYAGFNYSLERQDILSLDIQNLENEIESLNNKKKNLKIVNDKKIQKQKNELIILDNTIKESTKRQNFYKDKNIENLLQEQSNETIYKQKQNSLNEEILSLSKKGEEQAKSFDNLIEVKSNETKALINNIERDKNILENEFLNLKEKYQKNKEQKIKKEEEKYNPIFNEFEAKKESLEKKLNEINLEINTISLKEFLKDEKNIIKKNLENYKDKISTLNLEIQKSRNSLEKLDFQIQKEQNQADKTIDKFAFSFNEIKKEKTKEIEILRKRLDIDEDSFLKFLNDEKTPNLTKITTLLKDEILFSKDLNPKKIDNNSTLYGFDIDIKLDNSYDEEFIKRSIGEKNIYLENELLKLEKEKTKINQDLEKSISKIYKEKSEINKEMDKNSKELNNYETKLLKEKNKLDILIKKASELKNEKLAEFKIKKENLESDLKKNKEVYENLKKEYQNKSQSIKTNYTKEINLLISQKNENLENLKSKENILKNDLEKSINELKVLKQKALNKSRVDTKTLNQKEKELEKFSLKLKDIEQNREMVFGYKKDKEEYFDKEKQIKQNKKECESNINEFQLRYEKELKILNDDISKITLKIEKLNKQLDEYKANIEEYEKIKSGNFYENIKIYFDDEYKIDAFIDISNMQAILYSIEDECNKAIKELKSNLNKIFSKFKSQNVLNLNAPNSLEKEELLQNTKLLKEFYEQNKIKYFKDTLSSTYSMSLSSYTKQISDLLDASGKIKATISKINQNLKDLQNINVIEKVELKHEKSDDKIVQILEELKDEYNNNSFVNEVNLFNPLGADSSFNNRILKLFRKLNEYLFKYNKKEILDLEDSFILEFRAIENGHDTGFVRVLDDIGSNGTDVMVKVMVYIAMLNLSRKSAQKDKNEEIYLHCILDEIGILSPKYLKELISFANSQKIEFLNGAPDEKIVTTYKRVYLLNTTKNHKTLVNEIISKI
ncbi:ATP-binding protein [Malaciobacter pacificus]|uniref:DUF3584 domain-containing protein n=1 Tax=Malaciobacter pacificus TaxID=1080223 RepID=A0A5C2HEN6_9BACT|nr:ATP-binding protein [Malaciobacter pacificus]QEP35284.1 DUF3584 domain-containing protein [Malaciobacter pacificus]GGD43962.1 ATP-binding protein [Malaciobacter pacificus]